MMKMLNNYKEYFLEKYSNFPMGKYATLIILRQAKSELILRTEGSGEPLSSEITFAGIKYRERIERAYISKRKQTASERRTGRELLRNLDQLFSAGKDKGICSLNKNNPCGKCMDCMLYGYAVGDGGAQKSRIITDNAFSINEFRVVTSKKTFNAAYDNGTMRDPVTGEASASIGEDEYIKPETVFLDMETLKDLTQDELVYILGNVLRTKRYGAISSRIGKIENKILAVIFSNSEIFSNLELTQRVYDYLKDNEKLEFPVDTEAVIQGMPEIIKSMIKEIPCNHKIVIGEELEDLLNDCYKIYENNSIEELIKRQTQQYAEINQAQ